MTDNVLERVQHSLDSHKNGSERFDVILAAGLSAMLLDIQNFDRIVVRLKHCSYSRCVVLLLGEVLGCFIWKSSYRLLLG